MSRSKYEHLFTESYRFGPGSLVTITDHESKFYGQMAEVLKAQDLPYQQYLWVRTLNRIDDRTVMTELYIYSWQVSPLNISLPRYAYDALNI